MTEPIPWHRLFGLSLIDFFRGLPVEVEMEKDLSLKQQRLDVVILHKGEGPLNCRLPDGFEDLAAHNLITFKSYQETLAGWALSELVGHYVNYRKQISPSMREEDLLPETDFRLFAVAVRFPQAMSQHVELKPVRPGVYEVKHFTGWLRLIVIHELPQEEQNALLHLFSAKADLLRYGVAHYHQHSEDTSSVLKQLLKRYQSEAEIMPDLLTELRLETIKEVLEEATVEQRLEGISIDQMLAALSPEKRAELAQKLKRDNEHDNTGNG